MKALLFFLALVIPSLSRALSGDEIRVMPVESEIHARKFSCLSAESTVRRRGAVIVHHGEGLVDRVVAHPAYCRGEERAVSFYANTLDSEACFLGYRCLPKGAGSDALER